ncbi:hypothetical protein [Actinomadura rayongensis]|uniref:Uncharacterized protein n=1 Tax=Actinomadura rayongensis TaxID=1429076 RepID=A0A6I4W503_9ACTN|nr:hypothetical protein [Actinomadura rayongensis]MXQ64531.1 hypothetical protein [Actinomadura rayongensis]
MVRKKMEGNEEQRRKDGRAARAAGSTPSARSATTGSSKQTHSLPEHAPHHHAERLEDVHRGKNPDMSPKPRPGYGVSASKRHRG